jgi:hypothetical protein
VPATTATEVLGKVHDEDLGKIGRPAYLFSASNWRADLGALEKAVFILRASVLDLEHDAAGRNADQMSGTHVNRPY